MVTRNQPDVVLLDLTMPGPGFLEVLDQLKAVRNGTRVLVISAHAEDQYALRVLKAGASGYLSKDHTPQELVSAIRQVAKSGRYVSSKLAEQIPAGQTSLSPKTVSTYRTRLMEKLKLRTTADVIRYAVENGLVA